MKFIYSIIILFVPVSITAQTTTQNYTVATIPFQTVSDPSILNDFNSNNTIQYYDGSGRLSLTVLKAIAPAGEDMIAALEYDVLGRLSKNWLPAVVQGNNGAFYPGYATQAIVSNLNDAKPFSTTGYEASPLNRVISQSGPGNDWYTNSRKITTTYLVNGSDIKYFYVENDELRCNGIYDAATLYGVETTDEDGKNRIEYTDKQGRIVLSRAAGDFDTYYVYDDLGNLRYVLPPLAADNLSTSLTGFPETAGTILYLYAYIYHYDGRKRCIEKKLPGTEWVFFVYDKADRLILSQDGNQKLKSRWKVNKYDIFGRMLYSGLLKSYNTRSQMETAYSVSVTNDSYSVGSTNWGYTCSNPIPTSLLTVHYYDKYSFLNLGVYSTKKSALTNTTQSGYTAPDLSHMKSLMTGICTYHLDDSSKFELTSTYFDKYGRIVQVRSSNHLAGYDIAFNLLDFTGKATKTYKTHGINSASPTYTEVYSYTFDKAQRLLTSTHQLNGGNIITLSSNVYDKLGRLTSKTLGGISGAITYTYNLRGWLTDIIGSRFTESLYYNANKIMLNPFTACYNGNISGIKWSIPGENLDYDRAYSFAYDDLDRLTFARYCCKNGTATISGTAGKLNEEFAYDKMGNITSLIRYENGIKLNDLAYTLTGNQLKKINDNCPQDLRYGSEAFKDRAELETEYLYDKNGNNSYDANGDISTIKYNLLNLPEIVQFKAGHQNRYSYSADGKKLTVKSYTLNSVVLVPQGTINPLPANASDYTKITTDYIGNMIYQNGTLKQIQTPEGYIQGTPMVYYYYLKDHLGNARVVINSSGSTVEKSHYYPTGIRFYVESTSNSAALPFRYNGKEFEKMNGSNWYDYGARFYDPQIGRWHTIDPKAEESRRWSPYNYAVNNPIRFIDPDGMEISPIFDKQGKLLGTDDKGFSREIIVFDDPSKFKQNMDHEQAMKLGEVFDNDPNKLTNNARVNIVSECLNGTEFPDGSKLKKSDFSLTLNSPSGIGDLGEYKDYNYQTNTHYLNLSLNKGDWTVENIRLTGGVHEIYGHGIKSWGDRLMGGGSHHKIFEAQMDSKYWEKSTNSIKQNTVNNYWRYYYWEVVNPSGGKTKNMPTNYRTKYDSYK